MKRDIELKKGSMYDRNDFSKSLDRSDAKQSKRTRGLTRRRISATSVFTRFDSIYSSRFNHIATDRSIHVRFYIWLLLKPCKDKDKHCSSCKCVKDKRSNSIIVNPWCIVLNSNPLREFTRVIKFKQEKKDLRLYPSWTRVAIHFVLSLILNSNLY